VPLELARVAGQVRLGDGADVRDALLFEVEEEARQLMADLVDVRG
jgi:hypothetical protein